MGDNREGAPAATPERTIAGYTARCDRIALGDDVLACWRVADLERYVDREALLRADDPPEPPYWAHLWSGAELLAAAVPPAPGRVIEVGCGLGLPGVVAARRGGEVVFVDRAWPPLAFVRQTLRANGLGARALVAGDFTQLAWRTRFDLVLAAEVLYDRAAFGDMAGAFARLVAPGGAVLLADGHRIDTTAFYEEAARCGFACGRVEACAREEGLPVDVSLVTLRLG